MAEGCFGIDFIKITKIDGLFQTDGYSLSLTVCTHSTCSLFLSVYFSVNLTLSLSLSYTHHLLLVLIKNDIK